MARISLKASHQAPAYKPPPRSAILRSFTFLKKYKHIAIGVYALATATNCLAILIPQTIRWIVDAGIVQQNMQILLTSLLGLLMLTIVKGLVDFALGRGTEMASQGVAYDIRNAIYDKLSSLSFSYHDSAQTGQLLARSISDVERVRFLTGRAILRLYQHSALMISDLFRPAPHECAAGAALHDADASYGLRRLSLWAHLPPPVPGLAAQTGGDDHRPGAEPARRQDRQSLCPGRCRDRALRRGKQRLVRPGAEASVRRRRRISPCWISSPA